METLSLGMDLHKNFSWMTVVDQKGSVLHREKVDNTMEAMEAFFGNYNSESCEVAVEATWNWYWVYELLERMSFPVHLVHAERARAIASAKIKTDKIDSEILAQLLRMDYLPEAHIASGEARHRRERLRYRIFLTRLRSMLKHSIHTILAKTGTSCPSKCLFTKRSIAWLKTLSLESCYRENLDLSLQLIGHLDQAITSMGEWIQKETSKALTAVAAKLAGLVYQTLTKREAFNIDLYRKNLLKRSQGMGKEPGGVMVAA